MNESLDLDLAWGGYYAGTRAGSDEVSLFRLLDFNREGYHCAIYQEKFGATPEPAEVEALSPFIGHAPLGLGSLLRYEQLVLVAARPLTRSALEGYAIYLEEFGVAEAERNELMDRLIGFSEAEPWPVRLSLEAGEVRIDERS